MVIASIIVLLGGIALFLFGIAVMGDGLNSVAGNKLELILYKLTNSRVKGALLGTGVTAVIQSASATSVMVIGFVNSGLMQFEQALSVILGGILGTSVTAWVVCLSYVGGSTGFLSLLSTATISGVLALVGIIFRKFFKNETRRQVGSILLGLAILMTGMSIMSNAVAPLQGNAAFVEMMTSFSHPALGILAGIAFGFLLQSSAAAVGVLQALAATGVVTFASCFPMILGIGIGGALPVVLSAMGASIIGKRTALANLLLDVFGAIICAVLYYGVNAVQPLGLADKVLDAVGVAAVNTLFRLAMVFFLLPAIGLLNKLVSRLIKDRSDAEEEKAETKDIDRLEERFIAHPALAIEQSHMSVNAMAINAQDNLLKAMELRTNYSEEGQKVVDELEDLIDHYEDRLGAYLVKVSTQKLSSKQNEDIYRFLHAITDFERISDHAKNLGECAEEIAQKKVQFSGEALAELNTLEAAIREIMDLTVNAFIANDLQLAVMVEPLEELIDGLCDEMKSHHIERLQHGSCTLQQGFVFNDLLTNYERVSDHCSNVAVAVIEQAEEFFDSHRYLSSVKDIRNEAFSRQYEIYAKKYKI